MTKTWLQNALEETGLDALQHSSLDAKILIVQRLVRHVAYSITTLILATFLAEVGLSNTSIGLFMTLTSLGDMFISLVLTLIADGIGRRWILKLGAALMIVSGIVFAMTNNYWLLLLGATIGVITPSGNEIGPFRAVEESIIAHITTEKQRASIFAWYTVVGNLGTAVGFVIAGWITTVSIEKYHWTKLGAYRLVFLIYAALGAAKLLLTFFLTAACEADRTEAKDVQESIPLTSDETEEPLPAKTKLIPHFSQQSKVVLLQLCLLLGLDSFASGLAAKSWITYYFAERFSMLDSTIGELFFVSSILSAISVLVAASIAKRIGNVKTMVFTHLPSSIVLAFLGMPSQLWLAALLLVVRSCSQQMDTAPRSAFLAAIVLPNERTAMMGIVNTAKTIGQTVGPFLAGLLIDHDLFWFVFLLAGVLKVVYDLGMLVLFAKSQQREQDNAV